MNDDFSNWNQFEERPGIRWFYHHAQFDKEHEELIASLANANGNEDIPLILETPRKGPEPNYCAESMSVSNFRVGAIVPKIALPGSAEIPKDSPLSIPIKPLLPFDDGASDTSTPRTPVDDVPPAAKFPTESANRKDDISVRTPDSSSAGDLSPKRDASK